MFRVRGCDDLPTQTTPPLLRPYKPPALFGMKPKNLKGTEVPKPQVITWDSVDDNINDESLELSFTLSEVISDPTRWAVSKSNNGNHGFVVKTDQGTIVSFYQSNRDDIWETDDDGVCTLIKGTTMLEDGSLIPGNASSNKLDKVKAALRAS